MGLREALAGIEVGGKKVSPQQYDQLLEKAVDNIILSGFQDETTLIRHISINCYTSQKMIIKVLTNLMGIYQKKVEENTETMLSSIAPCHNILEISEKLQIIINVLVYYTGKTVEKLGNVHPEAIEADADEYEEDDELYEDEDEELDEDVVSPEGGGYNLDVEGLLNAVPK